MKARKQAFDFDPNRVAYFETEGWRAYYDRAWPRLLRLIVSLSQEQFHIPFPRSLVAAYYIVRASVAWVPLEHDERLVRAYYTKFYGVARRFSGLHFDPERAGALELRYNDDHRRLIGNSDKGAFIQTMIELHCELFGLSAADARASAELRVEACNTVDLITSKQSVHEPADWARILDLLRQCYRSVHQALHR
jgi:hypothetical protein